MIDDYYEDKYGKYLTESFFKNQFDDIQVLNLKKKKE